MGNFGRMLIQADVHFQDPCFALGCIVNHTQSLHSAKAQSMPGISKGKGKQGRPATDGGHYLDQENTFEAVFVADPKWDSFQRLKHYYQEETTKR